MTPTGYETVKFENLNLFRKPGAWAIEIDPHAAVNLIITPDYDPTEGTYNFTVTINIYGMPDLTPATAAEFGRTVTEAAEQAERLQEFINNN